MSHRPPAASESGPFGVRVTPRLIVWLVLLVLLVIFIGQNAQHVDVTLYFWEFRMRLIWVLLGAALIGAILGWLVPRVRRASRR